MMESYYICYLKQWLDPFRLNLNMSDSIQHGAYVFLNFLADDVPCHAPFLLSLISLDSFRSKWALAFLTLLLPSERVYLLPRPRSPGPTSSILPFDVWLRQELVVHTLGALATLPWLHALWGSLILRLEEVILANHLGHLDPLHSMVIFLGILLKRSLFSWSPGLLSWFSPVLCSQELEVETYFL